MTRRKSTRIVRCPVEGCKEYALHEYDSQRDARQHAIDLQARPWRCTRHRNPDEVLTPENRERVITLTVVPRGDKGDKTFEGAHSSFVYGPGFKAFATDWPLGTQIVIAVRALSVSSISTGDQEK